MKQKITLLMLTLFMVFKVSAQEVDIIDSLFQSPQEQFEEMTEFLDLSPVTTGLLADKSFSMIPYENFDGLHLADSNMASAMTFMQLYVTTSSMSISSDYNLPHPDDYSNILNDAPEGTIYLGGLHYKYHQFKENAIDEGLVEIIEDQVHDIDGAPEHPFEENESFLITPLVITTAHFENNFIFNSELFYSNSGKTLSELKVNFDDGNGLVTVESDANIEVSYESHGTKTIISEMRYTDGTVYTSHAEIFVEEPVEGGFRDYDVDILPSELISATQMWEGAYGSAIITPILACGHKNIQKPLIWVEGFNPKVLTDLDPGYNLDPSQMESILGSAGVDGKPILTYCEEEGYDLIYIDFTDGGDYLQKNAYVVKEVIRWVNSQKANNGSTQQNLVIGESMGGVIAKYALREMEIAGEDHETKTYMSLDSPHQGANIPLSSQYAVRHIPYIKIDGVPLWEYELAGLDMRLGERLLETPAAQQMLIYYAPSDFTNQTGTSLTSSWHTAFYDEYHALGDLANCETLMLSNASPDGLGGHQGFNPGDHLVKFKFNNGYLLHLWLESIAGASQSGTAVSNSFATGFKSLTAAGLWLIGSVIANAWINFELNALPEYSTSNERIYKGHFSVHFFGLPIVWTHKVVRVKKVYPYDSAPGGVYGFDIAALGVTFPSGLLDAVDNGNIIIKNNFNFIPAFSALDLSSTYAETPYADLINQNVVNVESSAYRTVLSDEPIVWNDAYGNPVPGGLNNSQHTDLYSSSARWFLFHLYGNNGINENATWSSGSFNFGEGNIGFFDNYNTIDHRRTSSRIDVLDHITGTGQVYVNIEDRIGNITLDNGPYTVLGTAGNTTNFVVEIRPECDQSTKTLDVDAGGLLYIGRGEYQTGEVHLLAGTTLTIGDGGALYIKPNSKLIVHPGAKLILEDGSLVSNEGQIKLFGTFDVVTETWDSGLMEYHDGAELLMYHEDAEIHFYGGDLLVKENAVFEFTHDLGTSGHLRFSAFGPHIHGETNSRIHIVGDDITDPIIYIDENADLWCDTPNELYQMTIQNGAVVINTNGRFVAAQRFTTNNISFKAAVGAYNVTRGLITFDRTFLSNSTFDGIQIEAQQIYDPDAKLIINNCTIEADDKIAPGKPVIFVNGKTYSFINSELNTASDFASLQSVNLNSNAIVSNSTFDGTAGVYSKVMDESNVLVKVQGSDFRYTTLGIQKENGELGLRCNTFDYTNHGVEMGNNSILYASQFQDAYGYNQFTNSTGSNLVFINSNDAFLQEGYNNFDENDAGEPIFDGTLNFFSPVGVSPTLSAQYNGWNNTLISPPSSAYNLYHNGLTTTIAVDNSNPELADCGANDPVTGTGGPYIGGVNAGDSDYLLPEVALHEYNPDLPKRLDLLVADAMAMSEVYDTLEGDNFASLALFDQLFKYDYSEYTDYDEWAIKAVLNFAYYQMKYTLQSTFDQGQITLEDNAFEFHEVVEDFAQALNERTEMLSEIGDNDLTFYNEIEKAQFYRLIGHHEIALEFLDNVEICDLDGEHQSYLNKCRFNIEEEAAKLLYGYKASLTDTVFTDSTLYPEPLGEFEDEYAFSSTISNLNEIEFLSGCDGGRAPSSNNTNSEVLVGLDVYPNPSTGIINFKYTVPDNTLASIEIRSADGKLLGSYPCTSGSHFETIDASNLSKGIYFYSLVVDGTPAQTGKVILK